MPLYQLTRQRVRRIQPDQARPKEDFIHRLIEDNLGHVFEGLSLVARKPRIGGKEFDTLALDTATGVPVIVEYKREKNRGVVEQVDLYYVRLKNNKADVLLLLQKANVLEDLGQVDFDNPQIIVVAKEFSHEQRELLTLKKNYLRLFRYQLYAGGILSLEQVEPLGIPSDVVSSSQAGPRTVEGPYDLDHFGMSRETRLVYETLDKALVALDSRVKPGKINKYFIGYGATGFYFCCVAPRVNSLRIEIKCAQRPRSPKGLTVRPLPEYKHSPMTHIMQVSLLKHVRPALQVIKKSLENSL